MRAQLSGLCKLFTSLKVKDYSRFTAGGQHTPQQLLFNLPSSEHAKPAPPPQQNQAQTAPTERKRYMI